LEGFSILVSTLKLIHLRHFDRFEVQGFDPQLNVIVGKNAQGKTSILEALSLVTQLKSFRSHRLDELIQRGQTQMSVTVELDRPTKSRLLIGVEGNRKKIRLDDKIISSTMQYEFLGSSVSFVPDDLYLLKGGPDQRREFFDHLIVTLDPGARATFRNFQKSLKQRNSLLKRIRDGERLTGELDLWTAQYIEAAERVYSLRQNIIRQVSEAVQLVYQSLFNVSETLQLNYEHGYSSAEFNRDDIELRLDRRREAEAAVGYTLVGPHRDDIQFLINDLDVRSYASQGQTRSLIIALKISQLELTRKQLGIDPILLLDDIISELDEERVHTLISYLAQYPGQLFVTTAESDKLKKLHEQFSSFQLIELSGSPNRLKSPLKASLNPI